MYGMYVMYGMYGMVWYVWYGMYGTRQDDILHMNAWLLTLVMSQQKDR